MERKKALTIPFTVDNDTLVCMTHVFEVLSLHDVLVYLCASSEQFAWLLLILARYCNDAYFIAAVIKGAHDLLIRNSTRFCLMALLRHFSCKHHIAKFSLPASTFPVVKGECTVIEHREAVNSCNPVRECQFLCLINDLLRQIYQNSGRFITC